MTQEKRRNYAEYLRHKTLGALGAQGRVAGMVGQRAEIFTILRHIVVLGNEKSGKFMPVSHPRSRTS